VKLQGKVALVTGGSSGIGRATALLFAQEGARVAVVGRSLDRSEAVCAEFSVNGGTAVGIAADVSRDCDAQMMIGRTVQAFGGLDILFNNAGIGHDSDTVETSEEIWDEVIDVNLKGVFLGCHYAIPRMLERGGGSIINGASTAGLVGFARRAAYSAAKGGVIAMTRSMAIEWATRNIRINALSPGATATPLTELAYSRQSDPALARQRHVQLQPIGRLSSPDEIARGALFLASGDSSSMTGANLVIDGGYSAV
jgi:meso-butanediol dehydrogenase / (S,S)-butanediol dehydrogenase / diacetyl reductase